MTFVHVSLLLVGGLFIAIPIVLHLVMRRRPKHLVFPALRFVKQRHDANRRTLQLRHWLLLLLRCLAIAVLAAALARPSVNSAVFGNWIIIAGLAALLLIVLWLGFFTIWQNKGRVLISGLGALAVVLLMSLIAMLFRTLATGPKLHIGDQEAPVAAVLVIDSAPRMQYRQENQTRLEQAQEIALWLLRQLPRDSEIAVIDSRSPLSYQPDTSPRDLPGFGAVFAVDESAAKEAVERLQTTNVPRRLVDVLEEAVELVQTSQKPRKELYVFTDLTRAAWSADSVALLRQRLDEADDLLLYVIDVGAENPQNFALGELELSGQTLVNNSELRVQTKLSNIGVGGTRTVELYWEQPDPTRPIIRDGQTLLPAARKRSQETYELEGGASQVINFQLRPEDVGVHHAVVRLVGEDGLPIDDQRYFTVEVNSAWPLLVAAPEGVNTSFLTEAIAPSQYRQTGEARYEFRRIAQSELANAALEGYAAVCLVDPAPLMPAVWDKLGRYVSAGGGLGVFLGHNAQPVSVFNAAEAQPLLGGKLARQWRSPSRDLHLAPRSLDHPILAAFRPVASTVPWFQFPVFRHWDLTDLSPEVRVVLPYSNNKPALLEMSFGKGRVLTMTTPISDPARPSGRTAWNELPTGDNAWPYFVLVNEIAQYLVSSGDERLNYLAGETATLSNRADADPPSYQMFTPRGDLLEVVPSEGRIAVKATDVPGAYRLKGLRGGPVVRGFSVNLPPELTDLTRTTRQRLDDVFGPQRYQFARNRDEIDWGQRDARVGREFYPYLIAMLALLLGLEHLLANRFYRKPEQLQP